MGYLAVYTTIAYHRFRFMLNAEKWPWYSRIDDRILVGAVPLKWMLDTLVKSKNVGGVVCCAEEWELKAAGSCGAVQHRDWDAAGVRVHRVPFEKHFCKLSTVYFNFTSSTLFSSRRGRRPRSDVLHRRRHRHWQICLHPLHRRQDTSSYNRSLLLPLQRRLEGR